MWEGDIGQCRARDPQASYFPAQNSRFGIGGPAAAMASLKDKGPATDAAGPLV